MNYCVAVISTTLHRPSGIKTKLPIAGDGKKSRLMQGVHRTTCRLKSHVTDRHMRCCYYDVCCFAEGKAEWEENCKGCYVSSASLSTSWHDHVTAQCVFCLIDKCPSLSCTYIPSGPTWPTAYPFMNGWSATANMYLPLKERRGTEPLPPKEIVFRYPGAMKHFGHKAIKLVM